MPPELAIEVRGVRVGYGAEDRLHGVTLEVPDGSFLAVVGPNGSGKSTLLRTMARALKPRVGTVLLEGRASGDWRPKEFARRVAVVSQESGTAFDFTAREVVEMGRSPHAGRISPDPNARVAVERAMREVGIRDLKDRKAGELSGGERQLVSLARALAQEPEVLLLDEPTNHLDISHQVAFMDVLTGLNARGVTVVMVVHDLNLAARYARRVVVVDGGKLHAAGPPSVALDPDVVRRVFGAEVELTVSPATGALHVQPVALAPVEPGGEPEAHVICGGGSGARLMRRLREEDVAFSAGVLGAGDTDHAVALSLRVPLFEEASFTPISSKAHARNVAAAKAARLVVVCDAPVGAGNLKNLEAAREAQVAGVPVVLLRDGLPSCAGERDYTGGRATALFDDLVSHGARIVGTADDAVDALRGAVPSATVARERDSAS